jgi:ACR3 family arsenite transporter
MAPAKDKVQHHSTEDPEYCTPCKENSNDDPPDNDQPSSAFRQLRLPDKFLALWIFLAMAIGIILGSFVPDTREALERGKFVGVSIPIGMPLYRKERR